MPPRMTDQEMALFRARIAELCGLVLDESKRYLLESRLDDVLRSTGAATWAELYQRSRGERAVEQQLIDALSTHETFFFREAATYDLLKQKLIPDLLGDNLSRSVAVWSAACSTGQEAYSLAIALEEILFDVTKCRVRITGTDISEGSVNAANRAEYTPMELGRGLTQKQRDKCFVRAGEKWRIRDELRGLCRFQVDNLLAPRLLGPFDIILCRNVLIYFSAADKTKVVNTLLGKLAKNGVLIMGATESLLGVTDKVRRLEFHGAHYYVVK